LAGRRAEADRGAGAGAAGGALVRRGGAAGRAPGSVAWALGPRRAAATGVPGSVRRMGPLPGRVARGRGAPSHGGSASGFGPWGTAGMLDRLQGGWAASTPGLLSSAVDSSRPAVHGGAAPGWVAGRGTTAPGVVATAGKSPDSVAISAKSLSRLLLLTAYVPTSPDQLASA